MDFATLIRAATVRPDGLEFPSAWSGHVPFCTWLVHVLKPRTLVELGTHHGLSYFNFCRGVKAAGLLTRCYAVDTWEGDEHAGHYGEEVFSSVSDHNTAFYSDISRLLRMKFDEAIDYFSDASINLLHIDGFHTYEAVKHDFECWLPKLAPGAVVLFHDTNVRERGFGVWRFWEELATQYPLHLDFVHSHGLGVLQLAAELESSVLEWLRPESPDRQMLVEYFGVRGAEMEERHAGVQLRRSLPLLQQTIEQRDATISQLHREVEVREQAVEDLRRQLASLTEEAIARESQLGSLTEEAIARESQLASLTEEAIAREAQLVSLKLSVGRYASDVDRLVHAAAERDAMAASSSWRITRPIRAVVGVIRRDPAYLEQLNKTIPHINSLLRMRSAEGNRDAMRAVANPPGLEIVGSAGASLRVLGGPRVVYVSGESHTPGHYFRIECYAEAARVAGAISSTMSVDQVEDRMSEIAEADIVVIWRAVWSRQVEALVSKARESGARIIFDVDDLIIDPSLARIDVIDGIRSEALAESTVSDRYERIRQTMLSADLCTVTTEELAQHARAADMAVFVLPNGYDEKTLTVSRLAARHRAASPGDGLLRIGYAGGSRTHQRDFSVCAAAVTGILRARQNVRLVLFRDPTSGLPLVDLAEFPGLAELEDCVEWRDLVPARRLPLEVARFDINLAPLEVGNPFCEAKSELKYFDAALAGVCTVASPTGPFRRVIRHAKNGFLAQSDDEWRSTLTQLLDDADLRKRMAQSALHSILWPFGVERRAERMEFLLGYLHGGRGAARAFVVERQTGQHEQSSLPVVPAYDTLFASDLLGEAEATVIMALDEHTGSIVEVLDSVVRQTIQGLDLVIVQGASTEDRLQLARGWAERNLSRFNRLHVLRHTGAAHRWLTRNIGFSVSETLYVLPLGPETRLQPDCLERCLAAIRTSRVAYVYPVTDKIGNLPASIGNLPFDNSSRLPGGNGINAFALVSKAAWACIGGYKDVRSGWEDDDLFSRMAERGLLGVSVGGAVLEKRAACDDVGLKQTAEFS